VAALKRGGPRFAWTRRGWGRQCFILSDQTFPAALPCKNGEFAKIIRIEDGTLSELIGVWLEITKGKKIPAGSVVVIFSSTHLLMEGLEVYAEDQVEILNRMDRIFNGGIITIPGIPVFMGGCDSPDLIRDLWDMLGWLKHIEELKLWRGWYELVGSLVGGKGERGLQTPRCPKLRMPDSLHTFATRSWTSLGGATLYNKAPPVSPELEKESSMAFCLI